MSDSKYSLLKCLHLMLNWWFRKTPVMVGSQDATERFPGNAQLPTRYEINVSRNGKHVFATDSHIRSYHATDIASLVSLFKTVFPDCKVSVMALGHRNPRPLDTCIIEALGDNL